MSSRRAENLPSYAGINNGRHKKVCLSLPTWAHIRVYDTCIISRQQPGSVKRRARSERAFYNEHIMTFIERIKLAPFHIVVCKVRFRYESGKNFN